MNSTPRLLYYLLEILHVELPCVHKPAEVIRLILLLSLYVLQLIRKKSGETQILKTKYLAMAKEL